jgi:hypothetical protein
MWILRFQAGHFARPVRRALECFGWPGPGVDLGGKIKSGALVADWPKRQDERRGGDRCMGSLPVNKQRAARAFFWTREA